MNIELTTTPIVVASIAALISLSVSFFIRPPTLGAVIGALGFAGSVCMIWYSLKPRPMHGFLQDFLFGAILLFPAGFLGAFLGFLSSVWGKRLRENRREERARDSAPA